LRFCGKHVCYDVGTWARVLFSKEADMFLRHTTANENVSCEL